MTAPYRHLRVLALALALASSGCQAYVDAMRTPDDADGELLPAELNLRPDALRCNATEAATVPPNRPPKRSEATTDAPKVSTKAHEARRLYEQERWAEAIAPLKAVARGDTDDALDTREDAMSRLAVVYYQTKDYPASLRWIKDAALASNPAARQRAIMQALRLFEQGDDRFEILDLIANLDARTYAKHSGSQFAVDRGALISGRALIRQGRFDEARATLSLVSSGPYRDAATECSEMTTIARPNSE